MNAVAYDRVKRAIDVLVGGAGLLLTLPLQALVALGVRAKLGSPIFFRQSRPGKDERIFELVKFRTMRNAEVSRSLSTDEQRMTKFGSFLRSTSLDELPTLWHVLKGDMSLVGPRPLLATYLPRYSEDERRRHEVLPGITGLAQVAGRNLLSWEDKLKLDVQYVDQRSMKLDLQILVATVWKVLRREGISADNAETMQEFLGTLEEEKWPPRH